MKMRKKRTLFYAYFPGLILLIPLFSIAEGFPERVISRAERFGIMGSSLDYRVIPSHPLTSLRLSRSNDPTLLSPPETLICDNGMAIAAGSNGFSTWNEAVRLTPSNPCNLTSLRFWPMNPDSEFPGLTWGVWDDDEALGLPNTLLDSGTVVPVYDNWFQIDLVTPIWIDSGDIYIGWLDVHGAPYFWNAFDDTLGTYNCNYWYDGSQWIFDDWFPGDFLVRGICNIIVGVEDENNFDHHIRHSKLFQNEPNPFHSTTLIRYILPVIRGQGSGISGGGKIPVRLAVYDITGRLIETLVDEPQEPGLYQIPISKHQLPRSGIYFYRLQSGSYTETRKIILLH